jgi:aminoglycoside 6'-N-acetyltransferase I
MVRQGTLNDTAVAAALALKLWPHHTQEEFDTEFHDFISSENCAVFLAEANRLPVGFAQCQLRRDYVEGTESSPVGYLEGIYVDESYRRQGIAGELLLRCEQWARAKGCKEFASDCEIDNLDSLRFHLGVGFKEANRIICFTKQL